MLIFIHNAFRTSTPMNFIFCSIYKVFCISVSVISKLVYSVILRPCIIIIRIHSKKSKQIGEIGMVGQSVLLTEMPTHFHQPNPPPSQPIDPAPSGNAAFIQKIATIFQELFKDYIRFSRTTY